jgi:Protein of unknown function (DUF4058)
MTHRRINPMPLRDHFRSPLDDITAWEGFHGQWPAVIVQKLGQKLPARYVAAPRVHSGSQVEIDVATYDTENAEASLQTSSSHGGVATAVWAPPQPTLAVETDLPDADEYEVRIYDTKRGRRLVAAIEIISPANKDRPEHRRIFVAKCAALLQQHVSVALIDLVTVRDFNLYADLLELLGKNDPSLGAEPPSLYAVACRWRPKGNTSLLETWNQPLALGQVLPTIPLCLADNFAVPLELEESYAQTCRDLRIP